MDLGFDGRIILKEILKPEYEGGEWIHLAQDRNNF
jgi:hypothetical protein